MRVLPQYLSVVCSLVLYLVSSSRVDGRTECLALCGMGCQNDTHTSAWADAVVARRRERDMFKEGDFNHEQPV